MHQPKRDGKESGAKGMLQLRAFAESDTATVDSLLCKSFGAEEMRSAIAPGTAPLSFVLQGPGGDIETACLGRVAKFGIFTVVADPESFDPDFAAENLAIFLDAAEADLRKQGACGIIVMVPPRLLSLTEHLQKRGFASEKATALYWKYLPGLAAAGETGSKPRPS